MVQTENSQSMKPPNKKNERTKQGHKLLTAIDEEIIRPNLEVFSVECGN